MMNSFPNPDFVKRSPEEKVQFHLGDAYDPLKAYKGLTREEIAAMFSRPLPEESKNQ